MKISQLPSLSKRPPRIAISQSLIVVLVAISLVLVETFSGALRYYFDQAGLSALLYLPKAACLGLFGLQLLNFKGGRGFWIMLLLLAIAALLGMLHGAVLGNVGFALYMYSPFLFGVVCGVHLEHRKRLLALVILFCLAASLVGIALDKYTAVPWKGYSYNIGDTELSANQSWSENGVDRIAGFTRLSTSLSVMIAIFSLYLSAFTRSRWVMAVLFAISIAAIYLTTNKSTVVAFACTLALLPLLRNRLTCRAIFCVVVAMGIALPIIGLWVDFDPNAATAQSGSLSSFYDRLINTWPNLAHNQWVQGWSVWGAGFGMVGSSVSAFPVMTANVPIVADNSALYLWATFGIGGLALYLMMVPLMMRLRDKTTRLARALTSICFCLTLISWTTDIPEVSVATLFLGMAVALVLRRKAMPVSAGSHDRPRPPRQPAYATPFRTIN
ncbi:hypothetical protein PMM47T1_01620 [Pseudomonas sp. M47T1]|uniref:O-antigen ligase family protein n=1 Tax=unclassified Pseudomonas TaxID=196821 RepID=UPI0002606AE4|nr:membrane protein [Pseudomonas sp. M47T1]EIK98696.1 hypothetical protein PMM47T1_01620 [Pseudomonas sp. M47T1]